jgi:hypothetical protein
MVVVVLVARVAVEADLAVQEMLVGIHQQKEKMVAETVLLV